MSAPAFIGDELNAAGYRLAGVAVYSPPPEQLLGVFRHVLTRHELIFIAVSEARRLPSAELNTALRQISPHLLVLPDILERSPVRDLSTRIRMQLGVKL